MRSESLRQIAYVTLAGNFDSVLEFWVESLNVGPWFVMDVALEHQTFRGEPTLMTSKAALAMHGGVQVELLAATNGEPSPYTEWIGHVGAVPRAGLFHHFLIDSDDHDSTCTRLLSDGFLEGYRGRLPDGRAISYLDGRDIVGSYVEVIQDTPSAVRVRKAMLAVSATWDGRDVRRDYYQFAREVMNGSGLARQ